MLVPVSRIARNRTFRPWCPLINPGPQQANLLGCERVPFFGHPGDITFDSCNCLDQQALSTLSGQQCWARITPVESGGFLVEAQPSLLLLRAVAFVARIRKQWLNLFCEIYPVCHRRRQGYWICVCGRSVIPQTKVKKDADADPDATNKSRFPTDGLHQIIMPQLLTRVHSINNAFAAAVPNQHS